MATVRRFRITVNGKVFEVEAEELGSTPASAGGAEGRAVPTAPPASSSQEPSRPTSESPNRSPASGVAVDAPLPGLVLDVKITAGDTVGEGQVLLILEAMKMENEIVAPQEGTIHEVKVAKGDNVASGDILVVFA